MHTATNDNQFTILMAEDSITQSERLKFILETNNFNVITAKNGLKALEKLKTTIPDLIISDIMMPGMNGYQLCENVKANPNTSHIPVILLTSLTSVDDVLEGVNCGADCFLTKPYKEDYLIEHINQVLEGKRFLKTESKKTEIEVFYQGKKRSFKASQEQILSLLISTYEAAVLRNQELTEAKEELSDINEHQEFLIKERTSELSKEVINRKLSELHVQKLNRLYVLLSKVNKAIIRTSNNLQLLKEICKISVEDGKFTLAWIGLQSNNGILETIEYEGQVTESLEYTGQKAEEMFGDNNPILKTLKNGKQFHINDIGDSTSVFSGNEEYLQNGYKSLSVFPVMFYGKTVGAFALFSKEIDFFDYDEINLLNDLTQDISFALEYIDKEEKRKQAEKDLIAAKNKAEESDRLKTAFLSNMSHEIRTPMNGILGFSNLLKEPMLSGDEMNEYISHIESSSKRMLNIINDIVCISAIESGETKFNDVKTDVNKLIDSIINEAKLAAAIKNLEIVTIKEFDDFDSFIITDYGKLKIILEKIIGNAIKFTIKGKVEIAYKLKSNRVPELEFSVKDTGIGIPDERQYAIYERFIQADIEDKAAHQGAGLGLTIAKSYVETMGGKLWHNSTLGVGSNFYFTIPYIIEEDINMGSVKSDIPDSDTKTFKALIVDDDQLTQQYLSILLGDIFKEVLIANDGLEAVDMCSKHPDIDVVLMDIKMPKMNGYEATKKIREFNKKVIIIAQTAYAFPEDIKNAISAGCNTHISKPVDSDDLTSIISTYIDDR